MNNVSSGQKISSSKEKIISNQKVNSGLSLERSFISIVQKYLTEIERLQLKKTETIDFEIYRQTYYDQMRNLSELFYVIQEYFPTLYSENPGGPFKRFASVVYNKIQEFYIIIHNNRLVAKNKDEYTCILVVLRELQATEKMLIPCLDDKPTRQKRCPRVDYTGMDMFEDDDEKVEEEDDEDYVEEEEDDEEDDEDYVEEEEEEEDDEEDDDEEDEDEDDDDYVEEEEDEEELLEDEKAEDEIFEIMMQQRVFKNQSNHIRFIYEDE
jgi:hypothetical protein